MPKESQAQTMQLPSRSRSKSRRRYEVRDEELLKSMRKRSTSALPTIKEEPQKPQPSKSAETPVRSLRKRSTSVLPTIKEGPQKPQPSKSAQTPVRSVRKHKKPAVVQGGTPAQTLANMSSVIQPSQPIKVKKPKRSASSSASTSIDPLLQQYNKERDFYHEYRRKQGEPPQEYPISFEQFKAEHAIGEEVFQKLKTQNAIIGPVKPVTVLGPHFKPMEALALVEEGPHQVNTELQKPETPVRSVRKHRFKAEDKKIVRSMNVGRESLTREERIEVARKNNQAIIRDIKENSLTRTETPVRSVRKHRIKTTTSSSSASTTNLTGTENPEQRKEVYNTVDQLRGHAWQALATAQKLGLKQHVPRIERYLNDSLMIDQNGLPQFNIQAKFPAESIVSVEHEDARRKKFLENQLVNKVFTRITPAERIFVIRDDRDVGAENMLRRVTGVSEMDEFLGRLYK